MHLLPSMSLLLTASAVYLPLRPRVDPDPCLEEIEDIEYVQLDGTTADGTAGIGAEFESPFFVFSNSGCSLDDTNAAKGEIVAERTGTNWKLTADSGLGQGKLTAEYILDGQNIKVGSGDGAKAGAAAAQDLIGWHPWTGTPPNTVNIANSNCNPWDISGLLQNDDPADIEWGPQVTAPMPLEALYSLMKEQLADPGEKNILDGTNIKYEEKLFVVTQEYFQSNKNGIDGSKVTDDVLAFCSLVLSYAKAASGKLSVDQSPKGFLTFMPRTEFNTIFQQVKISGDLFTLFDSLACYITVDGEVVTDTNYCTGPESNPISNNKFGSLTYRMGGASVNIKSWIQGIGSNSPSPDLLTSFDKNIDGSIGGFGTKMEKMYNSQRSVPLFEFRDLDGIKTSGFESFMTQADSAIQTLHKDFANPPTKMKKRQTPGSCTLPGGTPTTSGTTAPSSSTSAGVVAPVDPPSKPSCVPTPTAPVKDSHEDELQQAAAFFCDQYASTTVAKGPVNIEQTIVVGPRQEARGTVNIASLYTGTQSEDDVYDIKITSVDNCTPNGGYNLATPVANNQCADILHSAWKQCNNQGRGGAITAGCLVYSVSTKY